MDRWFEFTPVLKLSDNLEEAMDMMNQINRICERFPDWIVVHAVRLLVTLCRRCSVRSGRYKQLYFVMKEEIKQVTDTLSHYGTYESSTAK